MRSKERSFQPQRRFILWLTKKRKILNQLIRKAESAECSIDDEVITVRIY